MLPLVAAQMDLESVTLSEVRQREEKERMTSLNRGIRKEMIQTNLQNKRLTDLEKELRLLKRVTVQEYGKVMYTLLYLG